MLWTQHDSIRAGAALAACKGKDGSRKSHSKHAPAQVWEWLEGGTVAQEALPDSGAATPDSTAAAPASPHHADAAASARGAADSAKALSHIYGLTGELRPVFIVRTSVFEGHRIVMVLRDPATRAGPACLD